jgi:integrase
MASFFKRAGSPFYQLKVKRGGEWVMQSSGIRVDAVDGLRRIKKLAHEESAKEMEQHSSHGWGWVPVFLRTQFGGSPKTLIRYAEAWTALEVYLAEKKIYGPREVTHTLCLGYPDWRVQSDKMKPCKWNTALTELKVFSRILSGAIQREMIHANPCFRLGLRRRDVHVKPEITAAEQKVIESALRHERPWMRDSWTIAMCQGVRLNETNCPLSRIDLKMGTISVIGKGGHVHTAPLHPQVAVIARTAIKVGRDTLLDILPKKASLRWSRFFDKLGMKHLTFHSTRVTVVTRLARAGESKPKVMAYVGHASETVNDVYMRLSAPDVAGLFSHLRVGNLKA